MCKIITQSAYNYHVFIKEGLIFQAAASCYIDLIVKESDNNVKLIVLDRLIALKEHPTQERVLQDLVMDILRVLASPDLEVRKKTLNLGNDNLLFTS